MCRGCTASSPYCSRYWRAGVRPCYSVARDHAAAYPSSCGVASGLSRPRAASRIGAHHALRTASTARLGAIAFSLYAAVLLSFLGGVRCGIEIMRAPDNPNGLRLVFSALPALAGWMLATFVVFFTPVLGAAAIFAGIFAVQAMWDYRSARDAGAPAWYPVLRQVLTGGAMIICMIIPLATAMHRF
ncbi:MAG: DUF3429 domain-containing protein [Caulobacteraceae bacterium]|nr:DUF3429 domain-containing protein [Caulobacteraceae bacterium]